MYPLIGIACRAGMREEVSRPIFYSNKSYVQAIEDAGGMPILIPFVKDIRSLHTVLPHLDGLLLAGGADVHPKNYQENAHTSLRETDPQLDELELTLARWAWKEDMPTLGICRGLQVLNVALGGTLYQDLHTEYAGSLEHSSWSLPRNTLVHNVRIEAGSRMEQLLGVRDVVVNSLHHQAIKDVGKGLVVSGYAEDGVIELVEAPARDFIVATQSHPEELYSEHPIWTRLFKAFIEACGEKASRQVKPGSFALPATA
jgi:putative glutamine amidotransferase